MMIIKHFLFLGTELRALVRADSRAAEGIRDTKRRRAVIYLARTCPAYIWLLAGILFTGCAHPSPRRGVSQHPAQLRQQSLDYLKDALDYPHNPAVRVEAVEALESCGGAEYLPWLRTALLDTHPAVRFAGCVAVGRLRDKGAKTAVDECLDDGNASVRVGALFARHLLGHMERTGELATYLLRDEDPSVRRNAALVLGLMEQAGAVKLLARAMKDREAGVRHHALEAMARLGNAEAKQELVFMTTAGVGSEETFAIRALSNTGDRTYIDTLRYKLETAAHLETRLAAARGLGRLGVHDGFETALRGLSIDRPTRNDPDDPAPDQVLRIRQLAAAALGAIGRPEALPALGKLFENSNDARIKVSAAKAIVEITRVHQPLSPFTFIDQKGP